MSVVLPPWSEPPRARVGRARFDLVIPTVGRPSLVALFEALAGTSGPLPERVIVVDDRPRRGRAGRDRAERSVERAVAGLPLLWRARVKVVRSGGRGPAAARNQGWRTARAPWVVFLDDDVVPDGDWRSDLERDLALTPSWVAGVQGLVHVPLPAHRPPTDWERDVGGLEGASWITADIAYRRDALEAVGGFDEGFAHAFREDADLALRLRSQGWELERGHRRVDHPVRPAPWWVSIARQRGNSDDARMRARHGPGWRTDAGEHRSRIRRHGMCVAAGAVAGLGLASGRRRLGSAAAVVWAAATAELAWARIAAGPRTAGEIASMAVTSLAIPPVACWHRAAGELRARLLGVPLLVGPHRFVPLTATSHAVDAVLFDRDGTLVRDVPYNGDPARVELMPGARAAVRGLRQAGIAVGVISNQSGVAKGFIDEADVHAVNRRIDELLGPIDVWLYCPHDDESRCACRKPAPGLIQEAAGRLGVEPARCVVIGDIGSDVEAARRAGAAAILVPTTKTRPEEVAAADRVAPTLLDAVAAILTPAATLTDAPGRLAPEPVLVSGVGMAR